MARVDGAPERPTGGVDADAAPRADDAIALRIRSDDGQSTRTVTLPRDRFDLVNGKPTRLTGPNVRVIIDAPLYTNLGERAGNKGRVPRLAVQMPSAPAVQPNVEGMFDAPDVDLAQTTAFFAAQSVHDWATRTAGRPIDWTSGALPVTVHAWVTSTPETLNAVYDIYSGSGVALGTYGSVRDGRVAPYSGPGIQFLEEAAKVAPFGLDIDSPVDSSELERRQAVLARVSAAIERDEPWRAKALIANELRREPPRVGTSRPTGNAALDALLEQTGGRQAYFAFLGLTPLLMDQYKPVRDAFYESASDRMVAAHEAGHAALAAVKPSLSTPNGLGFHEAFGDIAAIAATFSDEASVAAILRDTEGDLRRSNVGSRTVDRLVEAVNAARVTPVTASMSRDASSETTVASYGRAMLLESRDGLYMPEAHDLSRVVSSAVYSVFANRANAALASVSADQRVATVRRVNDEVSAVLHDGILLMPEDGGTLADTAAALLASARRHDARSPGARMADDVRAVLEARGLLPDPNALPSSMVGLPAARVAPGTPTPDVLAIPEIAGLLRGWPAPEGSRALTSTDVTTSRGDRIIRVRYERSGDVTPPTHAVWTAAFTFDASGKLVAASHGA